MLKKKSAAATTEPAQRLSDELGLLEEIHARGGEVIFGAPTRCPDCGAMGVVDAISRGFQQNGCLRCGARWSFTAKAVALFEDAHPPIDQPEVVGYGMLVSHLKTDTDWAHVTRERFIGMSDTFEANRPRS